MEAYARRLAMSDMQDRLRAAHAWNDWESTHISLDPNWVPIDQLFDEEQGLAFATLVAHYWSNDGFLQNGKEILGRVSTIGHIPAVLIHGRRDISGPVMTAWRLHRLWASFAARNFDLDAVRGDETLYISALGLYAASSMARDEASIGRRLLGAHIAGALIMNATKRY